MIYTPRRGGTFVANNRGERSVTHGSECTMIYTPRGGGTFVANNRGEQSITHGWNAGYLSIMAGKISFPDNRSAIDYHYHHRDACRCRDKNYTFRKWRRYLF